MQEKLLENALQAAVARRQKSTKNGLILFILLCNIYKSFFLIVAQLIFLEVQTEPLCSTQCLLAPSCSASARIQHQANQCQICDDEVEFKQGFPVPPLLDTCIHFKITLIVRTRT